jgi:hypothetical protein
LEDDLVESVRTTSEGLEDWKMIQLRVRMTSEESEDDADADERVRVASQ